MILQLFGQRVTETRERTRAVGAAVRVDGKTYRPPIGVLATLEKAASPEGAHLTEHDLMIARLHGLNLSRAEVGKQGDPGFYKPETAIEIACFFEPA